MSSGKNRKKVLIVGRMPEAGIDVLKKRDDVDYEILGLKDVAAHYHAKLKDAHAVTLGGTPYRQAELDVSPEMMVVARLGVGFDAVDLGACRERGIRVTNTPDVLTKDVADLGVAMMLAQARCVVGAEAWVRDGSWAGKGLYPLKRRVHGAKAGILGLGRIGYEVAKRLAGFEIAEVGITCNCRHDSRVRVGAAMSAFADILTVKRNTRRGTYASLATNAPREHCA